MSENQKLTLAIQKKGRLSHDSLDLLQRCGLKLLSSKSSLYYCAENFPLDLLLVRDDDIPTLIRDGASDLGIVGENVLAEQPAETSFEKIVPLGFGRCRLSIAYPKEDNLSGITALQGKRIATSYPNLLQKYLQQNNLEAEVVAISGSVEIAPRLGMADVICDLVSTGRTLEENNLKELTVILQSQALLIKGTQRLNPQKQVLLDVLLRRIEGVIQAQESKYILFHIPKKAIESIKALLPGSEMPTIIPLNDSEDKVAVHVVSREGIFWDTLEKLRGAGATAILVLPVEKMMY